MGKNVGARTITNIVLMSYHDSKRLGPDSAMQGPDLYIQRCRAFEREVLDNNGESNVKARENNVVAGIVSWFVVIKVSKN